MKQTALALILVSALVFTLTSSQFASLGKGNPYHFPASDSPNLNPPSIIISSPVEGPVLSSSDIWLNFTVVKPESWLIGGPYQWDGEVVYTFVGSILYIQYNLDGTEGEKVPANDTGFWQVSPSVPSRSLNFSMNLNGLSEGQHELTVYAYGQFQYYNEGAKLNDVVGNSTISFTVASSGANTPNAPTIAVTAASAPILVGLALLVYFRKRKRMPENK